uniref:C3H1-type domain-containing protein n=1 Tax=Syphacia muris TaxID=451379 RepID=A0A0N5APE5_9BILA
LDANVKGKEHFQLYKCLLYLRHQESTLLESHDSCYSSCSDESQSLISRMPSDLTAIEYTLQSVASSSHLSSSYEKYVGFATKLGYTEEQLLKVLEILDENTGQVISRNFLQNIVNFFTFNRFCSTLQDQILNELIKLRNTFPKSKTQLPAKHVNVPMPISLRSIVIDGSNIAMAHGRKEVFSCAGINECVQFFKRRGHTDILVFVPQFRRETARSDCPITDQHILEKLDREKILVWTPSRYISGRRIVCHDDRYILKTAEEKDAVIVSNDEYRDLIKENPQYRKLVEQRLLMYTFVDGKFLPPDDPLGRRGPKLAQFLSKTPQLSSTQLCPYGRKCTYGNKCKYFHPERPNGLHVSVAERLIKGKYGKPILKHCLSATELNELLYKFLQYFFSADYQNKQPSQPPTHIFAPSAAIWGNPEHNVELLTKSVPYFSP